jgi:hypothetical protein
MHTWIQCLYKTIQYNGPTEANFEYWGNVYEYVNRNKYPHEYIEMHYFIVQYNQYIDLRKENKDLLFYIKLKYNMLGDVLANIFTSQARLIGMINLFGQAQRTYNGLARFAHIWRVKHSKMRIECDLCLNPIKEQRGTTMMIYQNGSRYMFKLSDLINICKSALIHAADFFAEPLVPKNPYTNIEFSQSILYEIYFAVRTSYYRLPMLLHLYYLTDFNIDDFLKRNEAVIRNEYILDYVVNGDTNELADWITFMLKHMKLQNKLQLHESFPNNILLDAMRPFLKDYFISQYSLYKTVDGHGTLSQLRQDVSRFIEANPQFGRKVMVRANMLSRNPIYIPSYITQYTPVHELDLEYDSDDESESYGDLDDPTDIQYETTTERLQALLLELTQTMNRAVNSDTDSSSDVGTDIAINNVSDSMPEP